MVNSGHMTAKAYRPTQAQLTAGDFKEDTEVVLEVADGKAKQNGTVTLQTTFAGAHAARDALGGLLHENATRSIVQQLEDELDEVMAILMATDDGDDVTEEQGWARGLGTAIVLMRQPHCDMDTVREQAMARWEANQAADESAAE